jgi:hypothetical protein
MSDSRHRQRRGSPAPAVRDLAGNAREAAHDDHSPGIRTSPVGGLGSNGPRICSVTAQSLAGLEDLEDPVRIITI